MPPPAFALNAITVEDISYDTATIAWQTSTPATSEVKYGVSDYAFSASDGALVTSHRLKLNPKSLAAGTAYHFIVTSVNSSGEAVSSVDGVFRTKGALVKASVLDKDGRPVKDAKVWLNDVAATTDESGVAWLPDLPLGVQTVNAESGKQKASVRVNLTRAANETAPHEVTFNLPGDDSALFTVAISSVLLALLVGAALLFRRFGKRFPLPAVAIARRRRQTRESMATTDSTSGGHSHNVTLPPGTVDNAPSPPSRKWPLIGGSGTLFARRPKAPEGEPVEMVNVEPAPPAAPAPAPQSAPPAQSKIRSIISGLPVSGNTTGAAGERRRFILARPAAAPPPPPPGQAPPPLAGPSIPPKATAPPSVVPPPDPKPKPPDDEDLGVLVIKHDKK